MKNLWFLGLFVLPLVGCDFGSFDLCYSCISGGGSGGGLGYTIRYNDRGVIQLNDSVSVSVYEVVEEYDPYHDMRSYLHYLHWGHEEGTEVLEIPGLPNVREESNALADLDGAANTTEIVAISNGGAAKLCDEMSPRGYEDYYLPAAGELKPILEQLPLDPSRPSNLGFWSSTEFNYKKAWTVSYTGDLDDFGFPKLITQSTDKNELRPCLCVRKM